MKRIFKASLFLMTLIPSLQANAADMMVRMRAINVMPVESGSPSVIGGEVKLNNESVPEVDFTYFINESFAFELVLATASHEAQAYGTALNNLDLGDVTLLPPTLTAQYHMNLGKLKPYVGAGVNYTFFYGEEPGVAKSVSYENSFGWALQVGVDYQIKEDIYLNLDLKRIALSTDVHVETYSNGAVDAKVDIDPLIAGIGIGYRF